MKVLVAYYSRTGNTESMAEIIAQSIKEEGVEVDLVKVEKLRPQDLLKYDGIIFGSPVYYGDMASSIKKLLDESVSFHGSLDGKLEEPSVLQQI